MVVPAVNAEEASKIRKGEDDQRKLFSLPKFKFPEPPLLVTGAIGGPMVMYLITPFRNALSNAATDSEASFCGAYWNVFSKGLSRAWTGGMYSAIYACPQFVVLGPLFHIYQQILGAFGGTVMCGMTETFITYGAQTKNAQLAFNMCGGNIPEDQIQPSYLPWGPGISLNILRNIAVMSGPRVVSGKIAMILERSMGPGQLTSILGDLIANIFAGCISMPLHQLYSYTVATMSMWHLSYGEYLRALLSYLSGQYFTTTSSGYRTISTLMVRDLALRSIYVMVAFTSFTTIERNLVKYWPALVARFSGKSAAAPASSVTSSSERQQAQPGSPAPASESNPFTGRSEL